MDDISARRMLLKASGTHAGRIPNPGVRAASVATDNLFPLLRFFVEPERYAVV